MCREVQDFRRWLFGSGRLSGWSLSVSLLWLRVSIEFGDDPALPGSLWFVFWPGTNRMSDLCGGRRWCLPLDVPREDGGDINQRSPLATALNERARSIDFRCLVNSRRIGHIYSGKYPHFPGHCPSR